MGMGDEVLMIWILAIAAQVGGYAGELKEHLALPPAATLTSDKPAYDMEICIADALTVLGTPTSLRDGPDGVVIVASNPMAGTYIASAAIQKTDRGSRVIVRVRGKGWNDRVRDRVQACL